MGGLLFFKRVILLFIQTMASCRIPREESKIFSPVQLLVGCSGKVLYKKLKPLRRSRADKIREKALEQDYLDKVG